MNPRYAKNVTQVAWWWMGNCKEPPLLTVLKALGKYCEMKCVSIRGSGDSMMHLLYIREAISNQWSGHIFLIETTMEICLKCLIRAFFKELLARHNQWK